MTQMPGLATLTFTIELAGGSVYEHVYDVAGRTTEELTAPEFGNPIRLEDIQFLQMDHPMAIYNLNHVARIEMSFEGPADLDVAAQWHPSKNGDLTADPTPRQPNRGNYRPFLESPDKQ
jgi:hypothetical protein